MPKNTTPPEPTFEAAIERLEVIVREMDSAQMPLDKLIDIYEEGAKLTMFCQSKLASAEKRVEIINTQLEGEAKLQPFETPSTGAALF